MSAIKEQRKQQGNYLTPRKNQQSKPADGVNTCGGCNSCHQMTRIQTVSNSPTWGGSDENNSPGFHKPCATGFFQRNLGNSFFQSLAGQQKQSGISVQNDASPVIQRKCSCGGSCAESGSKEEELLSIQPKLKVGPADDIYEQEADRVAGQIMRMPDLSTDNLNYPHVRTGIQRMNTGESGNTSFGANINVKKGGGRPLSPATRSFMEPRFGVDFSHVRLHTDNDSRQTASQIQAKAFTYRNHISLGEGEHESNQQLMAHELTHTIQQGGSGHLLFPVQRYSHQDCEENDLRTHIWPADSIAERMVEKAVRVLSAKNIDAAVTPLLLKNFMSATPEIATILGVFREIKQDFDDDDYQYECEDDCEGATAYVYGVWTDIHLCMNVLRGRANDCIASTIVHEFAHYSAGLDDESGRCYGCGNFPGCPAGLSPSDALDNADSYAAFAYELFPMAV